MNQLFLAACHKDSEVEKKSSSGGAFTAITDAWFDDYGDKAVVYGCVFDEFLNVKHIRADSREQRDRMRGSKYVVSDVSGIYKSVAEDIKSGFFVAFSGTPCQIAALQSFLGIKKIDTSQNLLTIEVICNGVGNNRFFRDYIDHLEKKYKGKAISCNFRGKSNIGSSTTMEIDFDNGKRYRASSTRFDWFYSLYYGGYLKKDACFRCPYASLERNADISIADMRTLDGSHNDKLKSLIIVNSGHGFSWIERAKKDIEFEAVSVESLAQPRLYKASEKPADYDRFWDIYEKQGYLAAQRFAGNNTFKGHSKSFVANAMSVLHLNVIFRKLRNIIKK